MQPVAARSSRSLSIPKLHCRDRTKIEIHGVDLIVVQFADVLPRHELINSVTVRTLAVAKCVREVGERPLAEPGRFIGSNVLRHRDTRWRARDRSARKMF